MPIDLTPNDFEHAELRAGASRSLDSAEFAWLSGAPDSLETPARRELLLLDVRHVGSPGWDSRLLARPDAIATIDRSSDGPNRAAIRSLFDAGYVCRAHRDSDAARMDIYARSDGVEPRSLDPRHDGVVAMSSLGSNGRFANQLFQFAYLRLYGLRHALLPQVPEEWEAREFYGLPGARTPSAEFAKLRFGAFDNDDLGLWVTDDAPRDIDLWGYFQEIPPCWRPHREFLRKLFSLSPERRSQLDDWIARVTHDGRRPLVAIHVRRGDYVHLHKDNLPWYRPVPAGWYADWVRRQDQPSAAVYVATDSAEEVLPELAGLEPLSGRDVPEIAGLSPTAIDFEIMRRADMLAIANSSFSRMAAILANDGQNCGCPNFGQRAILPYQPWIDPDFWGRFDDGGHGRAVFGYSFEATRARGNSARLSCGKAQAAADYFQAAVAHFRQSAETYRESAESFRKAHLEAVAEGRKGRIDAVAEAEKLRLDADAAVAHFRQTAETYRQSAEASQKAHLDAVAEGDKARLDAITEGRKAYRDVIAEGKAKGEKARREAIAEGARARLDAIADGEKAYRNAIAKGEKARLDAIAEIEKARRDAIAEGRKAYRDAIARVEKSRFDAIAEGEKARLDAIAGEKARREAIAEGERLQARARLTAARDREEIDRLTWLGSPRGIIVRALMPPSRIVLKLLRSTLARANPRAAVRIARLQKLIDGGRYREFVAAIRRGLPPPADPIDATNSYIDPTGDVCPKPSRVWGINAEYPVTVVLDSRGGDAGRTQTLESLRAQTLTGFALLCLGRPLAPDEQERFPTARPATSETWADHLSSEFVCWLKPGETLSPIFLETLVAALSSDRALGFAGGVVTFSGGARSVAALIDVLPRSPCDIGPCLMRTDDLPLVQDRDPGDATILGELVQLGRRGLILPAALSSTARTPGDFDPNLRPPPATPLLPRPISPGPLASMHGPGASDNGSSRLLVVVPWLPLGGSEVVLLQVLQRLASELKLTIATTLRGDHGLAPAFRELTADIHFLAETVGESNALDFLRHLVDTRRPALVLSSNSALAHAGLKRLKDEGRQFKWCDILHNDSALGHLATALRAHGAIDRYVAVSRRVGETLKANSVRDCEIAIIPNGVNHLEIFNPDRVDRAACRRAFGLDQARFTLGFVGRLSAEKRPDAFIRLASEVAAHVDLQVLMVGDGDREAEVEALMTKAGLKGAHLRGVPRQTVNMVYGACDMLAMTSTVEGMPLVALEALASGCPVASTDVGDVSRIIVPGVNGYLTDVDLPLGLADGIVKSARDPVCLAEMRSAARRSIVESGFTIESMQAHYAALFTELRPATDRS